jgi:hypothetical protein
LSNSGWDDDPSATRTDAESPEAKVKRALENIHADMASIRVEMRRFRDRLGVVEEELRDLTQHVNDHMRGR